LIDTSNAVSLGNTWMNCSSLTSFPHIDTSSVTELAYTWLNCSSLTSFPHIDTGNVPTFYAPWGGCYALPHEDCGGNTGNDVLRVFLYDDGVPVPSGDGIYVDCSGG